MIERIKLEGLIKDTQLLDFLAVEVPIDRDRYIPFALVSYALQSVPQNERLRLDLDKRTFAGYMGNDPTVVQVLTSAAGQIADIVAKKIRRHAYERLRDEFID